MFEVIKEKLTQELSHLKLTDIDFEFETKTIS